MGGGQKHPLKSMGKKNKGVGAKPTSKNTLLFTPNTSLGQIALQIVPFLFIENPKPKLPLKIYVIFY
jgi:hypothetical protein